MSGYDAVVVGGGPAGIFAAYRMSERGAKVLLVDEGKLVHERHCPMNETGVCAGCHPCNVMTGLGGSGLYSDGTLNLRPDIGGDLASLTGDKDRAWALVEEVDEIFLAHGAPNKFYGGNPEKADDLGRLCARDDIRFIEIKQRHIGTENTPKVIGSMEDALRERGVELLTSTVADDILVKDGRCVGVAAEGREYLADRVLLAPGRVGSDWVEKVVKSHNIESDFGPIDVGVRVEVPAIIMDAVVAVNHDPKFHIRTPTYDDFVRTFCTNHRGYVVKEGYDGFVGVNGHSMIADLSENTNFAFLVRVKLDEPVSDTVEYGRAVAELATTVGGGKPILQRLADLRHGRRSHENHIESNPVKNTLGDVTAGDISMALPHRVVTDIVEGLERLNDVIPGVSSDSTLLYAPEIKFYSMCVKVDENMASSLSGLYFAGDGAGLSRDIVNAAATGLLAAEGMLK